MNAHLVALRDDGFTVKDSAQVLNISSSGLALLTALQIQVGETVTAYVDWPVRREDGCSVLLKTLGRVVRRDSDRTIAASIVSYEFCTTGLEDRSA